MKPILLWTTFLYLCDILECGAAVRISISASPSYAVRVRRPRLLSRRNAKAFTYSYLPPVPAIPATPAPVVQEYQQVYSLQQPLASALPVHYMPQPVTYHQPVTIYPVPEPVPMSSYQYVQQQPSSYQQVQYSYNEPLSAPASGYMQPSGYQMRDTGYRSGSRYQARRRYDYRDDSYGGGYERQDDGYRGRYDDRDYGGGYGGENDGHGGGYGYGDDGYGGGYGHGDDGYGGGYGHGDDGYGGGYDRGDDGYGGGYDRDVGGYSDDYGPKKYGKKEKIVYVPVYRPRKKKKKMKIVSIMPGFYIAGGTQLFGKYKTLKACQKACAATPSCFAGDYNPWLKKCYLHTNYTACQTLRAHKKLVHFSKVPCQIPEAPMGLITLGAQLFRAIEQKGIKSLSDCLKRCATAGKGIPASVADINNQLCFGIDYDFGSHKCYFHVDNTNNRICPADGSQPKTPRDLVPNPAVVNIILCPGP